MSVSDILHQLEDDGAMALHDIEAAVEAFVSTIITAGGRTLMAMAVQAAQAVVADPSLLTSADKRAAAIASILPALEQTGVTVSEEAVANAVQVAIAALNAGQAPTVNTTAPEIVTPTPLPASHPDVLAAAVGTLASGALQLGVPGVGMLLAPIASALAEKGVSTVEAAVSKAFSAAA